jgi:hypothetical protein
MFLMADGYQLSEVEQLVLGVPIADLASEDPDRPGAIEVED